MNCSSCGAELRQGAKFCDQCAVPVGALSAKVAPERDPLSYIPKHLADKILTSRSALEGERKQVTVLFADLKGSMDLAERVDPEAWDRLLEPFFETLTDGVHRFEGSVNQYTGDGIMALFGAPIAHENHAQRACYAALHLREALRSYGEHLRRTQGLDFAVRMGLNSGEVLVRKIRANLRMEFTALGHAVGLAQRMEALAEPGSIYLTEATQKLVRDFFAFHDLGRFDVKGSSQPLRVFELEGLGRVRSRLEVSRERGFSRFVGRGKEIASLEATLAQTREGHGQVVGVVGVAGVGKSRLCLEFVKRCRASGVPVYEAHCPAHGKNVPLLPILELLRNAFGVAEGDSPAEVRAKIARDLVGLDPSFRNTLSALFELMGVGDPANPAPQMDPESRRRQLFSVIQQIMRVRAERGLTSVTLIDDMQWIDAGSEALLAEWVEAFEGSRGLLLLNFRPEYEPPWSHCEHYQTLALKRLGRVAVRELMESLLGTDPSLQGLSERIERETAGNPLFTEEVIQSLIEGGQLKGRAGAYQLAVDLENLAVPSSVESILAARIDRLSEAAKHVLQAASAIGRVVAKPILARVVGLPELELEPVLEQLKTEDFLHERALYPTTEYAFTHPLSLEVAYEALLRDRRASFHARIARAIEEEDADGLDERAALIAYHYERAREPARAVGWHQRAALWTLLNDPDASLRHWRRVRELVDELPDSSETLSLGALASSRILNLGWQLGFPAEEAARCFEDGRGLAERAGNLALLAQLHGAYGALRGINLGFASEYRDYAREAVRLADETDDLALQSSMRMRLVQGFLLTGRHEQVCELAQRTLREMPPEGSLASSRVSARPALAAMMGQAYALTGRNDEARRCLDEAARQSATHGWTEAEIYIRSNQAHWLLLLGDDEAASVVAGAVDRLAETLSTALGRSWAALTRGRVQLANGDGVRAVESFERMLGIAESSRTSGYIIGSGLGGLAEALLATGNIERGCERAREGVAFDRSHGLALDHSAWLTWASALMQMGDWKGAQEALDETQQRIADTGARLYQPHWHEYRAAIAQYFEEKHTRARELDAAHRLFLDMNATGHAERVARELADLE